MAELNGYTLTKEEEKACVELVKKLRKRKTYSLDFTGDILIRAKNKDEAVDIFWNWISEIQDLTCDKFSKIASLPYFEIAECNLEE